MQASSIAIIDAGVIPDMRSIARIIVLHMSAQFMQAGAQSIICVEQMVHACSHAAQASMQACITAASIAGMSDIAIISPDMASIILASISTVLPVTASGVPAFRHGRTSVWLTTPVDRVEGVMSRRVHSFRSLMIALAAALLGALSIAVATPAWAHDELIGASPSVGSEIDALPSEITLTFSGVLMDQPGATDVVVTDAAGTSLTDGDPALDGTRLRQGLAGSATGPVTVTWRVVSSDGHPVSGQYTFTVGAGATGAATAPVTPAPPASVPARAEEGIPAFVWAILGVILAAALGGLVAVLMRRARSTPED